MFYILHPSDSFISAELAAAVGVKLVTAPENSEKLSVSVSTAHSWTQTLQRSALLTTDAIQSAPEELHPGSS